MRKIVLKSLLILLCFMPINTSAQEGVSQEDGSYVDVSFTPSVSSSNVEAYGSRDRINLVRPGIDLNQIPSLFFTPSEQSLITEARLGLTARPPTDSELRQAEDGNIPMGPRELSLGGIIYASAGDWTIWLNGQKVTPDRLPSEILDIKVRKNNIKLKWFDAYTNQIFPIKLRTHQRFNIDTRIFLPGEDPREVLSSY